MKDKLRPTEEQGAAFGVAFDHLNVTLFGNELPRPMLSFSRNANIIGGYFQAGTWFNAEEKKVDEIAINANVLESQDIPYLMGILIHEMVHLWQHHFGKPSRQGYHNAEWCAKCRGIGLTPVDPKTMTPIESGGQAVHTVIAPGGHAEAAIADLPDEAVFPWLSKNTGKDGGEGGGSGKGEGQGEGGGTAKREGGDYYDSKSGRRHKYSCPVCGINAWAKAGVSLMCGTCVAAMVEIAGGEK